MKPFQVNELSQHFPAFAIAATDHLNGENQCALLMSSVKNLERVLFNIDAVVRVGESLMVRVFLGDIFERHRYYTYVWYSGTNLI